MILTDFPAAARRTTGVAAASLLAAVSLLGITAVHATSAAASTSPWTASWAASPERPDHSSLKNVTVRLNIHTSIGGGAVRIRLSNSYGTHPVRIGAATVGLQAEGATVVPGTLKKLTFNGGQSGATIPAGGQISSDGISDTVLPNSNLSVSLYLPTATGAPTRHTGHGDSYVSTAGDHADDPTPLDFPTKTLDWDFLSGVDVEAPGTSTVVALGDSITDGTGSTSNTDSTWPQQLFDRLQANGGAYAALSVVDSGIGGNELLRTSACCGSSPSALSRLNRDVLSQPGVKDVIVLLGTNDILGAHHASANQVIAGLKRLVAEVHSRGLRVFGGTITPSSKYTAAENQTRLAVNRWITTSGAYDGVIDFASAAADPLDSSQLNPAYDISSDGLHPNSLGYQAMADAVNLPDLLGYTYDDRQLDYSGPWTHAGAALHYTHGDYMQTEASSDSSKASVSFAFHGTGVEWIGPRGANSGIADVYLDGKQVATVDTYDPVTKLFQQNLYEAQLLSPGRHVLTIKPAGTKNPLSAGTGIAVDAIKVTG